MPIDLPTTLCRRHEIYLNRLLGESVCIVNQARYMNGDFICGIGPFKRRCLIETSNYRSQLTWGVPGKWAACLYSGNFITGENDEEEIIKFISTIKTWWVHFRFVCYSKIPKQIALKATTLFIIARNFPNM